MEEDEGAVDDEDAGRNQSPGDDPEDDPDDDSNDDSDDPRRIVLAPVDSTRLHDAEWLPPPVWEEAPGFTTDEAREEFSQLLAGLQIPPPRPRGPRFTWGYQGTDLLRYNRVEGFSLGARVEWEPPFSPAPDEVRVTGRLGLGTWVPDGRLELAWSGRERTVSLAGYHSVTPVDPGARSLGLGNSAAALLFGRDDGDYFRATGGRLALGPGADERPWYELYVSAEEHRPLPAEADFSVLGGSDPFRPGLPAVRLREYRAGVRLAPSWGYDPFGVQGGMEVLLERGEGDRSWTRGGATGRLAVPLLAGLRGGVELGGGHLWGDPPLQRHWFLGGTRSLRGYGGGAAVGTTYGRLRADLSWGSPAGRLSVFGDAGWAGDLDLYRRDDVLVSAGVGVSILSGLLRLDLARALRTPTGWRLEVHLDSYH
ncbi:MAG: hypothetical protein R3223_06665 [Longimicrobiales bacterium]|nr:hypothetical protein [Longimicrobiales bacterium]